MNDAILTVRDLSVEYCTDDTAVYAVNHLDMSLQKGETLGLVGETGAGKTSTALSIMGLLPDPQGHITSGEILFDGVPLLALGKSEMRHIRGKRISMIFQDPMTALNPIIPVGEQIAEVIRLHEKLARKDAGGKAQKMLEVVGIPGDRFSEYPHQFSGGMKQRVVIAIALACNPELLIADEPTTALDVTIQAQVLQLMRSLREQFQTSTILITHDLGVVAEMCDRVAIMYCGEIVESGTIPEIYDAPAHPYTIGLFGSIPDLDTEATRLKPIPGAVPDPSQLPSGCKFANRCPMAAEECGRRIPDAVSLGGRHTVKCFHPIEGRGAESDE